MVYSHGPNAHAGLKATDNACDYVSLSVPSPHLSMHSTKYGNTLLRHASWKYNVIGEEF